MKKSLLAAVVGSLVIGSVHAGFVDNVKNGKYDNPLDNVLSASFNVFDGHLDNEKKREAFLDQIICEVMGDEMEKYRLDERSVSYGGTEISKLFIPRRDSSGKPTEIISFFLKEDKSPQLIDSEKSKKGCRRVLQKSLHKKIENFVYEELVRTPNELILFSEGHSEKSASSNDARCYLARALKFGSWNIVISYLESNEMCSEKGKKELLSKIQRSKTLDSWIATGQGERQ